MKEHLSKPPCKIDQKSRSGHIGEINLKHCENVSLKGRMFEKYHMKYRLFLDRITNVCLNNVIIYLIQLVWQQISPEKNSE